MSSSKQSWSPRMMPTEGEPPPGIPLRLWYNNYGKSSLNDLKRNARRRMRKFAAKK